MSGNPDATLVVVATPRRAKAILRDHVKADAIDSNAACAEASREPCQGSWPPCARTVGALAGHEDSKPSAASAVGYGMSYDRLDGTLDCKSAGKRNSDAACAPLRTLAGPVSRSLNP